MTSKEKMLAFLQERFEKAGNIQTKAAYEIILDFAITHLPDIEINHSEMVDFILWLRGMDQVEDEDDIIAAWNVWKMELAAAEEKEKRKSEYKYEYLFEAEEGERCPLEGWIPITTDRIKHPEQIPDLIKAGKLRRISNTAGK